MQVKVQLQESCEPCEGSANQSKVFHATICRVATETEFAEALSLFILFATSLDLTSAPMVTRFIAFVVFDIIWQRSKPWQIAAELLIVTFQRIEDSGGVLTFANAFNESCLNAYVEEARCYALHFYPNLSRIFRTHGGNPGISGEDGAKVWNKKFNSKSGRCRPAFDSGRDHNPNQLQECGTCKYNHVCSKWVKDKGKNGQCLGDYPMHKCTNPQRYDEPVKA